MNVAGYSPDELRPLTPRMREVLASADAGRTAAQTALELGVAERTVYTIRAAAYARLGAHNAITAVRAARRRGELL